MKDTISYLLNLPAEWMVEIRKIAENKCEKIATVIRRAIREYLDRERVNDKEQI